MNVFDVHTSPEVKQLETKGRLELPDSSKIKVHDWGGFGCNRPRELPDSSKMEVHDWEDFGCYKPRELPDSSKMESHISVGNESSIDIKRSVKNPDGKTSADVKAEKPDTDNTPSETDVPNAETNSESKPIDYAGSFPRKVKIDGVFYYYADNGKLYRIGDNLLPNATYERNGYKYETDDKGRIISVKGTLQRRNHEGRQTMQDSMDVVGKGDEKEGDHRGHLIGDQFNGASDLSNMVPQDAHINQGDYKALEEKLASEVAEGKEVEVSIEVTYDEDSYRPSGIEVTYSIDGEETTVYFPNGEE